MTSVRQVIVVLCVAGGFVVMGSVFTPAPSRATDAEDAGPGPATRVPAVLDDAAPGIGSHRSLGSIETPVHRVEIHATDAGARYTVYALESPAPLASFLTAEEMRSQFPQIEIDGLPPDSRQLMLLIGD